MGFAMNVGPNKLEAVKALVKAGANPLEVQNDIGGTGLHMVANNKDADAELVRYVLELPGVRALINARQRGRTLTWKVILSAARLFVKMGTKKALIVKIGGWRNLSALMNAARSGNAAAMKVLVEEGGANTLLRKGWFGRGPTALDMLVGGENALEETRVLMGSSP